MDASVSTAQQKLFDAGNKEQIIVFSDEYPAQLRTRGRLLKKMMYAQWGPEQNTLEYFRKTSGILGMYSWIIKTWLKMRKCFWSFVEYGIQFLEETRGILKEVVRLSANKRRVAQQSIPDLTRSRDITEVQMVSILYIMYMACGPNEQQHLEWAT